MTAPVMGSEGLGNTGVVVGGPVPATGGGTAWQVALDDNLTGWVYSSQLVAPSPAAPIVTFSSSPVDITTGGSSTLTWASENATSCTGTEFSTGTGSPVSGQASVSPPYSTTYTVTCTGPGGPTTRNASVLVNPVPASFTWSQSLPIPLHDTRIFAPPANPGAGTETRDLVFMDGSLYAATGDWMDPQLNTAPTAPAQVIRLDFSDGNLGRGPELPCYGYQQGRGVYVPVDRQSRRGAFRP